MQRLVCDKDQLFLVGVIPALFLVHYLVLSAGEIIRGLIAILVGAIILVTGVLRPVWAFVIFSAFLINQRLFTLPATDISSLNFIIIPILISFFHGKKARLLRSELLLLVLGCFLALSSTANSGDAGRGVAMLKALVFFYGFMIVFAERGLGDVVLLVKAFVWGCVLAFLSGLLSIGVSIDARFVLGDDNNPNNLAIACVLAFSFVVVAQRKKLIKFSWFCFVSVVLVLFGLLTKSKTFLFGALAVIFIYYYCESGPIKRILLAGLFSVLILFSIEFLVNVLSETAFSRFVTLKNGDYSNGRIDTWISYIDYFQRDLMGFVFGGSGIHSYFNGKFMAAHNSFLEIIYRFGLVGLIFWLGAFGFCYRAFNKNWRLSKDRLLCLIPFIALLVTSVGSHSFLNLLGLFTTVLSIRMASLVSYKIGDGVISK